MTVCLLVPATVGASLALWRAKTQGPLVPDAAAIATAKRAKDTEEDFAKARCSVVAKKLGEEVTVFKQRAASAEKEAKDAAEKGKKVWPVPALTFAIPIAPAQSVLKQGKALAQASCKRLTEEATSVSPNTAAGWKAVETIAGLQDGGAESAQQAMAQALLAAVQDDKQLNNVFLHSKKAGETLAEKRIATAALAATARQRVEPALGLLSFKVAVGVGILLPVVALILSYLSLRSASLRRGKLLVALRRFANTPEAGLQAAAIVRLAAHHNGGEPGMVLGSAVMGFLAAVLTPSDNPNVFMADSFVAATMGGLLIGLAAQWGIRTVFVGSRWRQRTQELGDIEKPTIPVALVLGGVSPGLEKQFLRYFEALPIADAAQWVQKVAAQAEEQILAAADAAGQAQYGQPDASIAGGP